MSMTITLIGSPSGVVPWIGSLHKRRPFVFSYYDGGVVTKAVS